MQALARAMRARDRTTQALSLSESSSYSHSLVRSRNLISRQTKFFSPSPRPSATLLGGALMERACIAAIILLVVGCGNPSPPRGGSDANADAAGGAATTDDSGNGEMEGSVARGTGEASQGGGSDAAGATDAPASDPKTTCTRYIQTFCQRAAQCQNLDPSAVTACAAFAALCPTISSRPEAPERLRRWRHARPTCWPRDVMTSIQGSIFRARRRAHGNRASPAATLPSAKRCSARAAARAGAALALPRPDRATTA